MPRAPRQSSSPSPEGRTQQDSSPDSNHREATSLTDSRQDPGEPRDEQPSSGRQSPRRSTGRTSATGRERTSIRGAAADSDGTRPEPDTDRHSDAEAVSSGLSFRQAQAALELCLARLQDSDLDVEAMADLYRQALAYSQRCETVLEQVEQDVMQWDPERPDAPPEPFAP